MRRWIVLALAVAPVFLPAALAASDKDDDVYIKVDIKGKIRTDVVAIGGETTGITIQVKNVTWELDLGDNKEFHELAKKLNGQLALVKGTYHEVPGVEIPQRHIVKVDDLKPAEQ